MQDFKKAKEEMKRLGFDSWEEYQDYLDFMEMRKTGSGSDDVNFRPLQKEALDAF